MNRLILCYLFLFGFLSEVRSQDTTNYTALLNAIPDFASAPIDSMDQEWAVRNGVVPPITESDAEFELRYFIHGVSYYQGRIIIIKGYNDRFTAERFSYLAASQVPRITEKPTRAPSKWEKIKILDGFTGPRDMALWRSPAKLKPRNGWRQYMKEILESGMFSEPPPFNGFIEIKKASSYKRIVPLTPKQASELKLVDIYRMITIPLELEELR